MDAQAIEEANRLRIAMGMKPLPVPGAASTQSQAAPVDEDPSATFDGRQAQAYDNYRKLQEAEAAKRKREERAAAVKKAREVAQRYVQLEGKGLGEEDDEGDLDARAWLKSQKKRQKKIDQLRKAEEEKDRKAAAAAREHSARDLAGVKVGHDMSALLEDGEQVLTLKDTTVLENEDEGDELENIDLRAQEKLDERLQLKKKKPVYDPNDFDDTGERSILAQYDDDYGKKKKAFTLNGQGSIAELADILDTEANQKAKVESLSLDILTAPASDYLDVSEIKVKKPKKKKSKSTRKRAADDEDALLPAETADIEADGMVIDSEPILPKKRKTIGDAIDDDDDLQASLAAQRRDALKKKKRMRPEDLARQLKEEAQTPEPETATTGGGLVIDEISEFVGALQKRTDDDERKPRRPVEPQSVTAMDADSDDEDVEMANVKEESVEPQTEQLDDLTTIGVDEEKSVSKGMGAALALLRERGLVKESNGASLNERDRRHAQFLAEKNRRLAKIEEDARRQRERDRTSGLLDRMTQREKEEYARKQNIQREYQTSRVLNEMFQRDYTPNFEIKYTDDHGRNLDTKEAFKHMSHQFHGKGSGKGKTDKLLKKIEADKKREAASFLDDSQNAGMGPSSDQQLKKRKEAGVRLA
ncbi:hypothetical protein MCOR14_007738 [Pyricularia oryzae]|uniref:U4/U6.U5 tri-snRNP-associated protein snu66 n=1 Tax=Pyricularia oryzae TaxID=318829 RepID=A0A4P7NJB2_PYROR|nr:hypothetical protein MCOR34_004074 [Pyricularia oryzae]KAI6465819.1 hypothetical protein MCOR17_004980 [Pyricularia oryzae]KAI6503396.1 hypothetical protein MCOR13_005164 [Pyricularia oryzae]KAI6580564.1 hypothetical protein MCOR04_005694 [Pyricularia oryzae]KAI6631615.1 hypothetical protein MCOR14_007738 [Pyricularia oryzae]